MSELKSTRATDAGQHLNASRTRHGCTPGSGHPACLLIAGLGNELLGDDGLGVHAIRELEKHPIADVTTVAIGTDVLKGLAYLEAAERVLLLDSVCGGKPPETIYVFDCDEPRTCSPMHSIHSMSLREALVVLSIGCHPPPITVIGVEPSSLTPGLELSPAVRAALPCAVNLARETVAGWLAELLTTRPRRHACGARSTPISAKHTRQTR